MNSNEDILDYTMPTLRSICPRTDQTMSFCGFNYDASWQYCVTSEDFICGDDDNEDDDDVVALDLRTNKTVIDVNTTSASSAGRPLLWEFLVDQLAYDDDSNRSITVSPEVTSEVVRCCVRWEQRENHTFRIVDPVELAARWGRQKCKQDMTYEKLSRALRYYYRLNILAKVPGRQLTYKFMTTPQLIARGRRGAKPGLPHRRRTVKQDFSDQSHRENATL